MSLMSANWPQRVTSQFLGAPLLSTMNSSINPSLSRYFSRRCCLQMSAVCFCRFLVPNPIGNGEAALNERPKLSLDARDVSPDLRVASIYCHLQLSRCQQ